ncbi:MAG: type II secretion system protein [Desulfovibrio sp.]
MSKQPAGFTLLETIIIVVLVGILGAFLVTLIGPRLATTPEVVTTVRDEALTERTMERIQADYLEEINGSSPDNALATIVQNAANGDYDQDGVSTDVQYITFNLAGEAQASGSATDTLEVTVYIDDGNNHQLHRIVSLLAHSRVAAQNNETVNF